MLSLPPAALAASISVVNHAIGLASELGDRLADLGRRNRVGETVAAEQQRGVRLERRLVNVDEIEIRRVVLLRTDVAIHLVASRMSHRLELRELLRILALAHRRMIARDLGDRAAGDLVEPGVADVPDDRAAVLDDRQS